MGSVRSYGEMLSAEMVTAPHSIAKSPYIRPRMAENGFGAENPRNGGSQGFAGACFRCGG